MSLQEMPIDIMHEIEKYVTEKESTTNVLNKFKDAVMAFCEEKKISISPNLSDDADDDLINDFVGDYIRKTLVPKQLDSIISDYGISKSMKLFHDFHKIGLDSPDVEICEILSIEDYGLEREIVELIINEEIGYNIDWRTNGDGRLNTVTEYEAVLTAHVVTN